MQGEAICFKAPQSLLRKLHTLKLSWVLFGLPLWRQCGFIFFRARGHHAAAAFKQVDIFWPANDKCKSLQPQHRRLSLPEMHSSSLWLWPFVFKINPSYGSHILSYTMLARTGVYLLFHRSMIIRLVHQREIIVKNFFIFFEQLTRIYSYEKPSSWRWQWRLMS